MQCPSCKAVVPENSKFCNGCGAQLSGTGKSRAFEENKLITVVFTDISGYTAMSERMDAEEVKGLTRRIFSEISRITCKHGGEVDKLIGDCAMLLFGIPMIHEDDATRAVKASLEIHKYVDGLNSPELMQKIGRTLSMHTGINSGTVLAGELDLARGEEKVLGDTVNIASRLNGVAKPGEIVIGEATYRLLKGEFTCDTLPPQSLKGKKDAIRAYRLMGKKGKGESPEGFHGLRAALVGRDAELRTLYTALEDLDAGRGTLIRISAEAGGGKTRLAEEFKQGLDLSSHGWREGHAYTFTETISYSLWNDFFSRMWCIDENDDLDDILGKIRKGILTENLDPDDTIPYLASLFAIPTPETAHLDPGFIKTSLYEAVLNLISSLADRTGTILYFEDLHWADPSSLDLLAHVVSRMEKAALVICTHRPAAHVLPEEAIRRSGALRPILMELEPLTGEQGDTMLVSLLGGLKPPQPLKDFIKAKNLVNPFFIEEVVNNLLESGLLVKSGDGYRLTGSLMESGVPSTIQEVIFARIDRLEADVKKVLQTASVLGRSFFLNVLKSVSQSGKDLERCLSLLEQIDIIHEKACEADLEYMFKHALLQEVIYSSLLKKEKREIHERVAEIMERTFAGRLPEFYETLAFHFVRAENREKAVHYLLLSGKKCLDQYATKEANGHFRQAYDLHVAAGIGTEAARNHLLTILIEWGFVFYCLGHFKSQLELLERHLPEAESCRDLSLKAMYFAWLGMLLIVNLRNAESYAVLQRAMKIAEESGDAKSIAYANAWAANVCAESGLFQEGQRYGTRARELAKGFPDDHYLLAKTNFCTGQCFLRCGLVDKAIQFARESISLGHSQNKTRALVLGYSLMGDIYHAKGDFKSAVVHYQKASDYAPDVFYKVWPIGFKAMSLLNDDRLEEGEETLALYMKSTPAGEIPVFSIAFQAIAGLLASKKGAFSKAFKRALASIQDYKRTGYEYLYLLCCLEIGKAFAGMAMGTNHPPFSVLLKNLVFILMNLPFAYPKALHWFNETIRGSHRLEVAGLEGQAWYQLGLLQKSRRNMKLAKQSFASALEVFQKTDLIDYQQTAQKALAEIGN
jgi:class 3 adenylate cyclase/tetratricopeptide (TPR) repeat protein